MSFQLELPATFADRLAVAARPLIGLWAAAGSPISAEIVAGSGCDWVLLDAEHSPNGLESVLAQLHAMSAYGAAPLVRPPHGDTVLLKQYLDLGVQNLLIPMVDSAEQAAQVVQAISYPPHGVRGVGSALARSARWNRIAGYLDHARATISLTVQIESAAAVREAAKIAAVPGVDSLFIGPADLAASMGYIGQQSHPAVVKAVLDTIAVAKSAGVPVGVNAFVPADAERYIAAGANFVSVGADVAILARGTEQLVAQYAALAGAEATPSLPRASY